MKSESFEGGYHKTEHTQVGGTHYTDTAIQPITYILANNLPFCEGNVIKYVSRWKTRGGIDDLRKAKQYIDFLIEQEAKILRKHLTASTSTPQA